MTVKELIDTLGLKTLALPAPEREIHGGYAGDLLSWVMGRAKEDCVWATIMTNINIVAVASLADTAAIVICEGCDIGDNTISAALTRGVNLLGTEMPVYEFCARLSGITGT